MLREMALCHAEKLAVKESRKDHQRLFKVVRRRGKKSDWGLDRNDEKKNWADVATISALLLPDIPTRLETQRNRLF